MNYTLLGADTASVDIVSSIAALADSGSQAAAGMYSQYQSLELTRDSATTATQRAEAERDMAKLRLDMARLARLELGDSKIYTYAGLGVVGLGVIAALIIVSRRKKR